MSTAHSSVVDDYDSIRKRREEIAREEEQARREPDAKPDDKSEADAWSVCG